MKRILIAALAGLLLAGAMPARADWKQDANQKTDKAERKVKRGAHKTKVKSKKAAHKVGEKTTEAGQKLQDKSR